MSDTELIISTYNNPKSLALCLRSLLFQTIPPDVICIADDGSGPETETVIKNFSQQTDIPVRHIWHHDNGFEKSKILNNAVKSSNADYLIFIDGDVVCHPDFIARHVQAKEEGRFLVGSMIRLRKEPSRELEEQASNLEVAFTLEWLKDNAERFRITDRLKARPWPTAVMAIIEKILVPPRRSLGGCNCSMAKSDFIKVNGYDERMQYGGQDKELGERLKNAGLRPKSVRYTTPLLHLYHGRPYADSRKIQANRKHILGTRKTGATWTVAGIKKT